MALACSIVKICVVFVVIVGGRPIRCLERLLPFKDCFQDNTDNKQFRKVHLRARFWLVPVPG